MPKLYILQKKSNNVLQTTISFKMEHI